MNRSSSSLQVEHQVKYSIGQALRRKEEQSPQNSIDFYRIYPAKQLEKKLKMRHMQHEMQRQLSNKHLKQTGQPDTVQLCPENIQRVTNYSSLANPKDLLMVHKDERFYRKREESKLTTKLKKQLGVKPSTEKQLGDIYEQFDRTAEVETKQEETIQTQKLLSSTATRDEFTMVRSLKNWEHQNFKRYQYNMYKEYRRSSSPRKIARTATIQNNLDLFQRKLDNSRILCLHPTRKDRFTVTLQQDLQEEVLEQLENYDQEHFNCIDKNSGHKARHAVRRLNKGVLRNLDRLTKRSENTLLKQTQELNNYVKENGTIANIIKTLSFFIDKIREHVLAEQPLAGSSESLFSAHKNRMAPVQDQYYQIISEMGDKKEAIATRLKDVTMFKRKIEYNKQQMLILHTKVNQSMVVLAGWKDKLKTFIKKILKLGTDSRQTGITWLLERLHSLGEPFEAEHLPDYLDEKAKSFLLAKHRLELQIQEKEFFQAYLFDINRVNSNQTILQMVEQQRSLITQQKQPLPLRLADCEPKQPATQRALTLRHNKKVHFPCLPGQSETPKVQTQREEPTVLPLRMHSRTTSLMEHDLQNNVVKNVIYKEVQGGRAKANLNRLVYDQTKARISGLIQAEKKDHYDNLLRDKIQQQIQQNQADYSDEYSQGSFLSQKSLDISCQQNLLSLLESSRAKSPQVTPTSQTILTYQDDVQINDFGSRQEYIAFYQDNLEQCAQLKAHLDDMLYQEMRRLSTEFKYKDFYRKTQHSQQQIIQVLFGSRLAEKSTMQQAQS